jgi:hypothetical protein
LQQGDILVLLQTQRGDIDHVEILGPLPLDIFMGMVVALVKIQAKESFLCQACETALDGASIVCILTLGKRTVRTGQRSLAYL